MMHAYDKLYLDKARTSLARMLDFAVYDLKYGLSDFFDLFIKSNVAARFEMGEPAVIVGKSGVELAYEVLEETKGITARVAPKYAGNRSEEYWTGWVLAYYQWETALSFSDIVTYVPIKNIKALYMPYHEMDIRQFADKMNELYRAAKPETNLKIIRKKAGLSQNMLAELSGVPLRTVQQYEQRQKSINKAAADTVITLSQVLACSPRELLEISLSSDDR